MYTESDPRIIEGKLAAANKETEVSYPPLPDLKQYTSEQPYNPKIDKFEEPVPLKGISEAHLEKMWRASALYFQDNEARYEKLAQDEAPEVFRKKPEDTADMCGAGYRVRMMLEPREGKENPFDDMRSDPLLPVKMLLVIVAAHEQRWQFFPSKIAEAVRQINWPENCPAASDLTATRDEVASPIGNPQASVEESPETGAYTTEHLKSFEYKPNLNNPLLVAALCEAARKIPSASTVELNETDRDYLNKQSEQNRKETMNKIDESSWPDGVKNALRNAAEQTDFSFTKSRDWMDKMTQIIRIAEKEAREQDENLLEEIKQKNKKIRMVNDLLKDPTSLKHFDDFFDNSDLMKSICELISVTETFLKKPGFLPSLSNGCKSVLEIVRQAIVPENTIASLSSQDIEGKSISQIIDKIRDNCSLHKIMDKYMATLISVLWPLTINETSDKIEVFDKLRVEYIQQLGKWGVELDFPKAGDKYNPDKHDPIREAPSSD